MIREQSYAPAWDIVGPGCGTESLFVVFQGNPELYPHLVSTSTTLLQ